MGAGREEVRGLARGVVGPARVIAFGTSIVAPAGSAVTLLVLVMAYAGFASPLVVLICTGRYRADQRVHAAIAGQHGACDDQRLDSVPGHPGGRGPRRLSRHHHLVLRRPGSRGRGNGGLRGPGRHCPGEDRPSALHGRGALAGVVAQPAAHRHHRCDDLRPHRVRGFEAAAALGEEARNTRRSVPASIVGAAVNAAIRILFTMGREQALPGSLARLSGRRTPVVAIGCLAVITLVIGLPLTYVYGGGPTFGYLAGIGSLPVVLIYLAVNIAVIRTEFRDEFRLWRHLLIPAAASVVFLFPLWGILFPGAYTLVNLLPFIAVGWLLLGAVAAGVLRRRRPATFETLGRVAAPGEEPD